MTYVEFKEFFNTDLSSIFIKKEYSLVCKHKNRMKERVNNSENIILKFHSKHCEGLILIQLEAGMKTSLLTQRWNKLMISS